MPYDVRNAKHIRYKMADRAALEDEQFADRVVEGCIPYVSTQRDRAPGFFTGTKSRGLKNDGEGQGKMEQ